MSTDRVSDNLAAAHLAAWSQQDTGAVDDLYALAGVYEDVAAGRKAQGRAAVKAFMAEAFMAVPNFKVALINEFCNGSTLACEWLMSGTPAHKLDDVEATGKSFSVRGVSYAELSEGKIQRWSDYYDRQLLLAQLGVIQNP